MLRPENCTENLHEAAVAHKMKGVSVDGLCKCVQKRETQRERERERERGRKREGERGRERERCLGRIAQKASQESFSQCPHSRVQPEQERVRVRTLFCFDTAAIFPIA